MIYTEEYEFRTKFQDSHHIQCSRILKTFAKFQIFKHSSNTKSSRNFSKPLINARRPNRKRTTPSFDDWGSDVNVSILRFQRSFVLRFQRPPKTVSNRWKFMRMIIQRLPSRHDNDNNDDGNDLAGITRAGKECTCSCGLILQDGQNCVYLRHVYTEWEKERETDRVSEIILLPSPTDPNRVIIESLPRDSGRRRV